MFRVFRSLLPCLVLAAVLFSGCTMEQRYHIKEDNSGTYSLVFDMSSMLALMDGEEGSLKEPLGELNMDSMVTAMNGKDGISNTKIEEKDGVILFSYDFANIDAFNRSMGDNNMSSLMGQGDLNNKNPQLVAKGKKLIYTMPPFPEDSKTDMDEMQGMGEMVMYKMSFTFDKPIKKVKNPNAVVSFDKKTVTLECKLTDLLNNKVSSSLTIKR